MLAALPSSVPVTAVLAGIWRDDLRLGGKPTSQQQLLQPAAAPGSQVLQEQSTQQQQMTSQHQAQLQPHQALAAQKQPGDSQPGQQQKADVSVADHAVPAAPAAAASCAAAVSPTSAAPRVGYSTDSYWDSRYAERSTHFDWFFNYSALASLIQQTCDTEGPCLHVGCGNSGLSEGMVHDGFEVRAALLYGDGMVHRPFVVCSDHMECLLMWLYAAH
jgi:hypothetical protein